MYLNIDMYVITGPTPNKLGCNDPYGILYKALLVYPAYQSTWASWLKTAYIGKMCNLSNIQLKPGNLQDEQYTKAQGHYFVLQQMATYNYHSLWWCSCFLVFSFLNFLSVVCQFDF